MWAAVSICILGVIILVNVILRNFFLFTIQIVNTRVGINLALFAKLMFSRLIKLLNHAFSVFLDDRDWSSIVTNSLRSWWLFIYYHDLLFI